jgi:hypothetical protein
LRKAAITTVPTIAAIPAIVLPCVIALLLSACGGGGGGGNAAAAAPPVMLKLASTNPGNAAIVGVDAVPAVTFDAAPDPTTITLQSVALRSPIGPVDSRVALSGNTVTVTPAVPLVWGSHYKVNISDTVRGSAGTKLAATFFGFDTRMPTWSSVTKVGAPSTGTTPGAPALTGGARNGDAVAAWGKTTDTPYTLQLMLQRYSVASGTWTPPLAIKDSRVPQSDRTFDLGVNDVGGACVVWVDDEYHTQAERTQTIKAVHLDAAGGWTEPVILWTVPKNTADGGIRIAMSNNGSVIATWSESSNRTSTIYAANYDAGSRQWSPPYLLRKTESTAANPVVRIAADGTAMLLWTESDSPSQPGVLLIHAAGYDVVKKSWGAAVNIQGDNTEDSLPSDVAFDANGNAIATWFKLSSSDTARTGAARYNAATGTWGKPTFFSSSTIEGSRLAMDAAGNALLVRTIWSSPTSDTFESSRYEQSSDTWLSLPSQNLRGTTGTPRMDAAGNGLLAWVSHDDKYTINVMRYNADKQRWDAPQVVASDDGYIENPILTTDQTGQALLVWTQHVGDNTSPAQVAYARLTGR